MSHADPILAVGRGGGSGSSGAESRRLDRTAAERSLADALRHAGWPLNTRCGQRGLCQGCSIELLAGRVDCDGREVTAIGNDQPPTLRGCRCRALPGVAATVGVPPRSLLQHTPQVVSSFRLAVPTTSDPLWRRGRPGRGWQFAGDHWTADGADVARPLGAAVDVGTTTVVIVLVDLATGEVVGQASALNAQTALGDNVLTRINLCLHDAAEVGPLQRALVEHTLGPLLQAAAKAAGQSLDQLVALTIAGNTTMLHLLAGIDPAPLGTVPFTPVFTTYRRLRAGDIGLAEAAGVRPDLALHLLPSASAYVGADVVAGALATGLAYRADPCLLLDLGTNGEIVLAHGDQLWGCATAAGPAFEGAGLVCGMRAADGAVTHLWWDAAAEPARWEALGAGRPLGLCGTAYLDFVARARRAGLLSPTGRILATADRPDLLHDPYHGRALQIAEGPGRRPLFVSEADVATLLQAKAAIAAGIRCLLRRAGLRSTDLGAVFVAGGFGFHMQLDSLCDSGLLPDCPRSRIELVGNSSLAGAYAALIDSSFLDELCQLAPRIQLVELNLEPDFETTYIDELYLP